MQFTLSAEQEAIRERVREFIREVCDPLEHKWAPDDYDVDPDLVMTVVAKFREYGLRGISVPKQAGGHGYGTVAKCVVYEEILKSPVLHGGLTTWSGLLEPNPALYDAPEWQKEKYLYPILRDDRFFHIHISEPGTGSDAAGITTTAVRDGDNYIINGTKRWAPPPFHPAVTPDYLLCYAVTDPAKGHNGISMFLVDYPHPGVSVVQEFDTIGSGYLGRSCDYRYTDCVVPAENMLGAEGLGFRHMMDQLNRNRCVIGARLVGAAQWAQDKAVEYASKRSTFGRPLADRQAVQWMIADSEIDIEQLRLLVYQAAWMLDEGLDARREVAMVKCRAPIVAARVIDRAMQIYGGLGMVKESRLAQLYYEARIGQVAEGTTEMMKLTVARHAFRSRKDRAAD
ncbi:acyl-CoA dehydrogenase family protein [Nocardia sp. R7R-8]|uniref:acyl-CoA dehydrogenase family protein n=1 Tax=Nocardia sp. R7R-8 TaxID=3459304 RepID=UPI00403D9C5D